MHTSVLLLPELPVSRSVAKGALLWGHSPPACCLSQCLPCNQATLYLGAVGTMLFLQWHFLLSWLSKQRLFRYQSSDSWIREKLLYRELEGCRWDPSRVFQLKGQRSMRRRLGKYSSQFHCDCNSCLLDIYNPPILSRRGKMAYENVCNRQVWNEAVRESQEELILQKQN